ncbi:MAG: DsbA family protein [Ilumatobacteraceae bacterium]|jgi:2-hydroxychromene-2-carboxylate isomerase
MRPDVSSVDFHFDPLCPYAYQTSKWIRSVREQNGLDISWRFFSLEEINRVEGKKHPWERDWTFGWSLMRVGALLRRTSMDNLDRWYERIGRALHEEGLRPHRPEVARELLAELGLDSGLVDESIADTTTNDEVLADHQRVVDAAGYGAPTLFFGEHCLFGPVLVDPPVGAAALRLWEAVTAWVEFPDLFELQQPKTREMEQRITRVFEPYLNARDWVSINRGEEIAFTEDGFQRVGPADRDRSEDS